MQVSAKRINSFDGTQFLFEPTARKLVESRRNKSTSAKSNSRQVPSETNMQRNKQLSVELSPSLYQLKELNLKCRTIIEQPLIEFEQLISLPIATSASQLYVRVDQQQQLNDNWQRQQNSFQTRQHSSNKFQSASGGATRNNKVIVRMRTNSSSAASFSGRPTQLATFVLLLAIVAGSLGTCATFAPKTRWATYSSCCTC